MVQSEDGGVGMDALAADMAETNAAVQDDLQAELFAASIDLGSREWVATLGRLRPQLQEFSLQHLNAELSPEEDAEAEARITEALTGHIDACYE